MDKCLSRRAILLHEIIDSCMALVLEIAARTDKGKKRSHNEDAFLAVNLDSADGPHTNQGSAKWTVGQQGVLLAVSDGLGGAKAGEVASEMSVEGVFEELRRVRQEGALDKMLQRAVARASRRVRDAGQTKEREGMGATLTATLIESSASGTAHIVQVGDSRGYLLRDGALRQITHDQSYVQSMIDAGDITEEEAERSPLKNVVSQVMGQPKEVRAALGRLTLHDADRVLLCSDGLSNALSDDAIRAAASEADVGAACKRLIDEANAAGGPDNITVILAAVSIR
jgi:PPM family protein phosphatase